MVAARSTALARSVSLLVSASISRIRQAGQAAETTSRSRAISAAQLPSGGGGLVPPRWLTLRKQPSLLPHGGRHPGGGAAPAPPPALLAGPAVRSPRRRGRPR